MTDGPVVHPTALVETSDIGAGTRIWAFAHVLKGARIGRDCNICDHCFVEGGAVLGDRVTLKNGVAVWDGVTVEDDAFLGPNVALTNERVPRPSRINRYRSGALVFTTERTRIGKGATIGANATIVCGITVGEHAFVGAGSVVTRDVPAYGVVYGVPGRLRGYMCSCGHRITASGLCACGRSYCVTGHGVVDVEVEAARPGRVQ